MSPARSRARVIRELRRGVRSVWSRPGATGSRRNRARLAAGLLVASPLAWLVSPPAGAEPTTAAAERATARAAAKARAAAQGIALGEIRPPRRRAGSWVAKLLVPTGVRRRPGGRRRIWRARTATAFNRQAQRLLVLGTRRTPDGREWLRVRLPVRPNRASGWIRRDLVLLSRTRYWVTVDLSARRVRVHRARRFGERRRKAAMVKQRRAVVGKRSTPTPRGLHAVYETVRQPDPNAFLGTWALHLTAHSEVLYDYGGGDGRTAIHGRGGRSFADPLGSAASNGCVRMNNGFIGWLARHADAGTPVRVLR